MKIFGSGLRIMVIVAGLSVIYGTVPVCAEEVPGIPQEVPAMEAEVPAVAQEMPDSEAEVPAAVQEVPAAEAILPAPVQEAPAEEVQTPAAPVQVDLIIFAGQSNMSGNGGNPALAPAVLPGQGYEYRPVAAPGQLTPLVEPFGKFERGLISDAPEYRRGSLVSAFVSTYYSKTGTPVVAVPAMRGGSDSSFWASAATKADLLSRYIKTKAYLESNNFTVRRKFLVFMQGETEAVRGVSGVDYKNDLIAAFQPLFANGLEQVFIITPGYALDGVYSYDDVVNAQTDLCNSNDLFTLGSSVLHSPGMNSYLADAVHYGQAGLNLAGSSAGAVAAAYAGGGY